MGKDLLSVIMFILAVICLMRGTFPAMLLGGFLLIIGITLYRWHDINDS